jgi:hypothetical protein
MLGLVSWVHNGLVNKKSKTARTPGPNQEYTLVMLLSLAQSTQLVKRTSHTSSQPL